MRFPTLEQDYWALVSGESRHADFPEKFWIPPLSDRQSLKVGDGAKLIFEIESQSETGDIARDRERMWVVVSELAITHFIGRLTNQPAIIAGDSDFYLKLGVEVPFLPEHVIDIDRPPQAFLDELFSEKPRNVWPR